MQSKHLYDLQNKILNYKIITFLIFISKKDFLIFYEFLHRYQLLLVF